MQAHEKQRSEGVTMPGARRTGRRSAGMVYLAIAAILGVLVLVTSVRGCQQHHQQHPSVGKWHPTSGHGWHAGAATPESVRLGKPIPDDRPSGDAQRRQNGILGVVRRQSTWASATSTAASATGTVLVDYQVHQPVLTPEGATLDSGVSNGEAGEVQDSCQVVLMDHVFAYSYGEPYIGE